MIKVLTEENIEDFVYNNDYDSFFVIYDTSRNKQEETDRTAIALKNFETAAKYILKHHPNPRVRFGKVDCGLNPCHYFTDTIVYPTVRYFRTFEHHRAVSLEVEQESDQHMVYDYVHVYASQNSEKDFTDELWPIEEFSGDYLKDHEVLIGEFSDL